MWSPEARPRAGLVFRAIAATAAGLAFVAAQFHQYAHDWLTPLLFAALAVTALVLLAAPSDGRPRGLHAGDLVIGALAGWLLLATTFSVAPTHSLDVVMLYLLLPLTYLIGRLAPDRGTSFAYLLIAATFVLAGWALATGVRTIGFFNSHHFAALLAVALLPALALSVTGRRLQLALLPVLTVLACALAVGGSRGAFLAVTVAAIPLLAVLARDFPPRRIAASLAAVAAGFGAAHFVSGGYSTARAMTLVLAPLPGGGAERLLIWKTAAPLLFERPLTGFGPGMTAYVWSPLRDAADTSSGYYMHNDYLQFAIDAGWPAALLLLSVLLAALAALWQRRTQAASPTAALRAGAAAAVVALLVHTSLDFHLQSAALLIATGMLMAVATADVRLVSGFSFERLRIVPVLALLGCALVAGLFAYQRSLIPTEIRSATPDAQFIMLKRVELAARLLPADERGQRVRAAIYRTAFERLPAGDPAHEYAYATSRNSADQAIESNPYAPWAYYERGRLESARGTATTQATAEADLREALRLRPLFVEARLALAEVLARQDRTADSLRVLADGLPWVRLSEPTTALYLLHTEALAAELGDVDTETAARQLFETWIARGRSK